MWCWAAVRRHSKAIWNVWKGRTGCRWCVWIWPPATERWCKSIFRRHALWPTVSTSSVREPPVPGLLAGDRSHGLEEPRLAVAHAPSPGKPHTGAAGTLGRLSPRQTGAGGHLSTLNSGSVAVLLEKGRNQKRCRKLARRFLRDVAALRCCGLAPLAQLGHTLYAWREEIACMWRFSRNNGITEGFHTKMEVLQRQAYGFRNFQNYRLRVRVMCS